MPDSRRQASSILLNKKERKRGTLNRNFVGDYIGFQDNPALRALVRQLRHHFGPVPTAFLTL